jgi:hypothetical protein
MPAPLEINLQLFRSSAVPSTKRGYQNNGVDIDLPSAKSTDNVSSVTITLMIEEILISEAKKVIPISYNILLIDEHESKLKKSVYSCELNFIIVLTIKFMVFQDVNYFSFCPDYFLDKNIFILFLCCLENYGFLCELAYFQDLSIH